MFMTYKGYQTIELQTNIVILSLPHKESKPSLILTNFISEFFYKMYSSIKPGYWKKKKARLQNWWSEAQLFRKIWLRNNLECQLTWEYVSEVYPYCFVHILPKWLYPELRLDPNNIIFVKYHHLHTRVDQQTARNKAVFLQLVKEWKAIERLKEIYEQDPPQIFNPYNLKHA